MTESMSQSNRADGTTRAEEVAQLRELILKRLISTTGKDQTSASQRDWFIATALVVRDRIIKAWIASKKINYEQGRRRVYYLSLEFLIGRLLMDALTNLGLTDEVREALAGLDVDLDKLSEMEPDAALGNGGLGRLAACFMESMATLEVAAYGYGIRYDHGLFRQAIKDGWQHEYPEDWLAFINPWEFPRPEIAYAIGFGGSVESLHHSSVAQIWRPSEVIEAVAYDTPIAGWRGRVREYSSAMELARARSLAPRRLQRRRLRRRADRAGPSRINLQGALSERLHARRPGTSAASGIFLRLRLAAGPHPPPSETARRHHEARRQGGDPAQRYAPGHRGRGTDAAPCRRLRRRLGAGLGHHAGHVLLHEPHAAAGGSGILAGAADGAPASTAHADHLSDQRLPSGRLAREGRRNQHLLSNVSLIDEYAGRRVRMGNFAFLGSHKINGVSQLHSDLMKETVFHDLHSLYPDRIVNKTNGITFRRWLFEANSGLTKLLIETIGPEFLDDPEALRSLEKFADDSSFQAKYAAVRHGNKEALAKIITDRLLIKVDPAALFDVQIKRIHEYKRQLLNVLETIAFYNEIHAHPTRDFVPRVKIFAGKAAASYHQAKLIIKLIHDVARVVNNDPSVRGLLKVVFLPNFNVSLAQSIIPAADLSEQISTAGMEASGTGNMKFALNGALTIGTLDGANVEICERVGRDNIFIFGMTAQEVQERRRKGIDARESIAASPQLREVLDSVASGVFSHDEKDRYRQLVDILTYHDHFMVTADFEAYCAAQREADTRWRDRRSWWRSSILNTARVGWFSSDRTIKEYAEEIWRVPVRPA